MCTCSYKDLKCYWVPAPKAEQSVGIVREERQSDLHNHGTVRTKQDAGRERKEKKRKERKKAEL